MIESLAQRLGFYKDNVRGLNLAARFFYALIPFQAIFVLLGLVLGATESISLGPVDLPGLALNSGILSRMTRFMVGNLFAGFVLEAFQLRKGEPPDEVLEEIS